MSKEEGNMNRGKASMNILKKIMDTIRTESQELTDAVMGASGTGKIEQEFESAEFKLKQAKRDLTEMMRKQRKTSRVFDITLEKINLQEALIVEALAQDNESEAMKHAFEMVGLETNKNYQIESIASITTNIEYLQRQLEQSEREIKEIGRQLTMIKTTENVQKATETIMGNIEGADANLMSAKKSLDRIRDKQKNKESLQSIENHLLNDYGQGGSTRKTTIKKQTDTTNSAQNIIKRLQDKNN